MSHEATLLAVHVFDLLIQLCNCACCNFNQIIKRITGIYADLFNFTYWINYRWCSLEVFWHYLFIESEL